MKFTAPDYVFGSIVIFLILHKNMSEHIRTAFLENIIPDKVICFQPKSIDIFLISQWKHYWLVLIRSASVRRF